MAPILRNPEKSKKQLTFKNNNNNEKITSGPGGGYNDRLYF